MSENEKIFIIDDDEIIIFGMRKLLAEVIDTKYIASFENGELALDSIQSKLKNGEEIPEVIFLDINMPIMDGWQFLQALCELDIEKRIRINIITSSVDPADYEKWLYFQKRTNHYLDFRTKPVLKIIPEDISFASKAS
ncbi:MAG: response regulator [Allomuricauda sp.]|nr:MAG: response regulator [Allomuricauda sp.]